MSARTLVVSAAEPFVGAARRPSAPSRAVSGAIVRRAVAGRTIVAGSPPVLRGTCLTFRVSVAGEAFNVSTRFVTATGGTIRILLRCFAGRRRTSGSTALLRATVTVDEPLPRPLRAVARVLARLVFFRHGMFLSDDSC